MAPCYPGKSSLSWSGNDEKEKSVYIRVRRGIPKEGEIEDIPLFEWYDLSSSSDSSPPPPPPPPSSPHKEVQVTTLSPILKMTMPTYVPDSGTAVAFKSRIYVVGGVPYDYRRYPRRNNWRRRGSALQTNLFYFDTDCPDHGWKEGPSMMTGRFEPSAIAVDGKIYVFGGLADDFEAYPYAEVFDPMLDKWEALSQPPWKFPFVSPIHALLNFVNLLVHPVGNTAIYSYNLVAKSWTKFDQKFGSDWGNQAAVVDGVLYSYCDPNIYGYDLVNRKWFSKPVRGLEEENVLPPDSYDYDAHLLHVDRGKLCVVWSGVLVGHTEKMLVVCTKFTVDRHRPAEAGEEDVLVATIESSSLFHVHGRECNNYLALQVKSDEEISCSYRECQAKILAEEMENSLC